MKGYAIDVRGFSENKKKRVQDAFSKLGIKYETDFKVQLAKVRKFTNVPSTFGEIKNYLMCGIDPISVKQKPYEITYEQLMEEANMKEELSKNTKVTVELTVEELLHIRLAVGKGSSHLSTIWSLDDILDEMGLEDLYVELYNKQPEGGFILHKDIFVNVIDSYFNKETPDQIKARELREQMEQMAKELKQLEENI